MVHSSGGSTECFAGEKQKIGLEHQMMRIASMEINIGSAMDHSVTFNFAFIDGAEPCL